MRDVMLKRIRPMADRLATELAELAAARIEAEVQRIEQAFGAALSSYESDGGADVFTKALGPELAAMLSPPPEKRKPAQVVHRDVKPDNPQLTIAGRKPNTCTKCGFIGGNSRGCGTARGHQTIGAGQAGQAGPAVDPPERRSPPRPDALSARRATIAALQAKRPHHQAVERDEPDDQDEPEPARPPGSERWTKGRIALEASIAEARKAKGEMPVPISSFDLGHDGAESGMASVREVGPEDELDFEASA